MHYQVLDTVLLLLHYGHICRRLLLCRAHVILWAVVIQMVQYSLYKKNFKKRHLMHKKGERTIGNKVISSEFTSFCKLAFLLNMSEYGVNLVVGLVEVRKRNSTGSRKSSHSACFSATIWPTASFSSGLVQSWSGLSCGCSRGETFCVMLHFSHSSFVTWNKRTELTHLSCNPRSLQEPAAHTLTSSQKSAFCVHTIVLGAPNLKKQSQASS